MSSLSASHAGRAMRPSTQLQLALRRRRPTSVRNASTTASEVADAAKSRTNAAATKASEGLSRVKSAAGPALSSAAAAAEKSLGNVGGRTGRVIRGVQSMVPFATYYSKIGLELGKKIAESRQMSPPSMATFQTYFQPLLHAARNPGSAFASSSVSASSLKPSSVLNTLRNLSQEQAIAGGIIAAEVLGFFTVGEMIGRRKIVGYRTSEPHEEH